MIQFSNIFSTFFLSILKTRFDFSQVLGPDRIFNSKQTFLKIELPEQVQLDPSNTSTWTIEDRGLLSTFSFD